MVPAWDARKRRDSRRRCRAAACRAIADHAPWTLSRIDGAPCPDDPSTGTREGVSAARPAGSRGSPRSRRRSRPGNPTIMSEPIDACGRRVDDAVDERAGSSRACRAGASRPACGRSRAAAADGNAARTRPLAATSIDDRRRAIHRLERADPERHVAARRRRARAAGRAATTAGSRSRPYDPRWTPVSGDFLEASRGDALDFGDQRRRSAALRDGAARRRDDAVGAAFLAAGLRADGERGAAGDAGLDRGAAGAVTVARSAVGRRGCPSVRPRSSFSSLRTTRTTRAAPRLRPRSASRSSRWRRSSRAGFSRAMRRIVCRAP